MRLILAIIGLILFVGNYEICELFYSENLNKWWGLKQNIYNIIIAIFVYLAYDEKNKYYEFLMYVFLGFCISNCIDRIFYDVNSFRKEDIIMILLTFITAIWKYNKKRLNYGCN